MVRVAALVALLAALAPATASAEGADRTDWREARAVGVLLEGMLQGAAFTEGGATGGVAGRVGLFAGHLVLFASAGAFISSRERGLDHFHRLLLAGAGAEWWLRRPWLAELAALGGAHPLQVSDPRSPAYQDHVLPAAGLRLAARRLWPRGWPHLSWGFSAMLLADLRRDRDVLRGGRVGGVAGLLGISLGVDP